MKEKGIYFLLFSYSSKKPKRISFSEDDYEICRNDKIIDKNKKFDTVEYYEIYKKPKFFSYNEVKVNIDDIIISLKIKLKRNQFIFNDELIREEYNKVGINNLNNEEEFYFFYLFLCRRQTNDNYCIHFTLLINSILEIIKKNINILTFGLLLNILIIRKKNLCEKHSSETEFINNKQCLLLNLCYKGDLSIINKDDINLISKQNLDAYNIYIIFQDIQNIEKIITYNSILDYLKNYKLFRKSLKLFPNYLFLIDKSDSLEQLKTILYCSSNLLDFIQSINAKKEYISKFIIRNKEQNVSIINLNDFFNENDFGVEFNYNFYICLLEIKEYEIENKTKIIKYDLKYLKK